MKSDIEKKKVTIQNGDEVLFLGVPKNSWSNLNDYGLLKEGEAYIVHMVTPHHVSIVGVPGLHDKNLFERI